MNKSIDSKREFRAKMNDLLLQMGDINIKRFFALDSRVYDNGYLNKKTKELLGLVASTVLRCNDCIFYHLDQCSKLEISDDELVEALSVALVVGGSITIPHLRFAIDQWIQLHNE